MKGLQQVLKNRSSILSIPLAMLLLAACSESAKVDDDNAPAAGATAGAAGMLPGDGATGGITGSSTGGEPSMPMDNDAGIIPRANGPNIVLVITDDQGYGDLSGHGNPIVKTPMLDALAQESVRLTDFHVAPTCAPSRAALQTGHWTDRTGVWHTIMGRSLLREGEVTIGQVLSDAGYATGMFGKWHLGDNYPFRPEDRGYTEVLRHGGGGVGQTPDYWDNAYFDGTYFRNSSPEPASGFCTDVWFAAATQFISEQKAADRPFFAYISTNAPHSPYHSPPEFSAPYSGSTQYFFGMIANIDEQVGLLRQFLEDEGLAEDTIFIFMTDNGSSAGSGTFNAGMRGAKGSEYDGGHRVPFFIHWPNGGLVGGRDVDPITGAVDVMPTLLDLVGVDAPATVKFDGVSLRPLLEGNAQNWPERIYVTDSQRVKDPVKWRKTAVMTDRWRLVNGDELYDIDADPGQNKNVAGANADVVAQLTDFYDAWWAELSPGFAEPARIVLGNARENPSRLTAHDWLTDGTPPWNQRMIRQGPAMSGQWAVRFDEAGTYRFVLRRWPAEVERNLSQGLPAGADVPGATPYRARQGEALAIANAEIHVAGRQDSTAVAGDAAEVVFELDVPAGDATLAAEFTTADGSPAGPYYVSVEKL